MARSVECMECGERVSRREAVAFRDDSGELVGWLCRVCAFVGG